MDFKTINRVDAQKAMSEWVSAYPALPEIEGDDAKLRADIQEMNRKVRKEAVSFDDDKYYIDAHFGLHLYNYLWKVPGFTMRVAADDGFWRYLSVKVAPDVVAQRWGKDNNDHFWSKPTRIWFRTLWWYVHLSWQGDLESTKELLENKNFTTDTILNFVERNGRKGTCVDAYRQIIRCYGMIPEETVKSFGRRGKENSDDLFRVVMKLNTAKMLVMEPALCFGGEEAYAETLFSDAGVNVHASKSN